MTFLLLIALLAGGIPACATGSAFVDCLLESSVARLVASDAAIPVEGSNASPEACSVSSLPLSPLPCDLRTRCLGLLD